MACALTSHEVRVSEILKASKTPMTAAEILGTLKAQFQMHSVRLSDVNTTLYNSGLYSMLSDDGDPKWSIDIKGSTTEPSPFHRLDNIPPVDVVPDGEFQGRHVVVGGDGNDGAFVEGVIAKLLLKGAGSLTCLVGQSAGKFAAKTSSSERTEIDYTPKPSRADLVVSHQKAIGTEAQAAALAIIGPEYSESYCVHHILTMCEAQGVPVYFARCNS